MQTKIPDVENFFSRLQSALEVRKSSLADLSAQTGIALSTMYRWRESAPHARTLKQIAESLGVSASWLKDGDGEMESKTSVREMAAHYKFVQRAPFPLPSKSSDLQAGCIALLNAMTNAKTAEVFDYAVLGFEDAWAQFKEAKYSELNQITP